MPTPDSERAAHHRGHHWPVGGDVCRGRGWCGGCGGAPRPPHAAPQPHPRHGAHHCDGPDAHGDGRRHVPQARPATDARHAQRVRTHTTHNTQHNLTNCIDINSWKLKWAVQVTEQVINQYTT